MGRTIAVELADLQQAFAAWCARQRLSPPEALRQLNASILIEEEGSTGSRAPSGATADLQAQASPVNKRKEARCVRLRLGPSDQRRLRRAAAGAGLSSASFVLAAIAAAESGAPSIAGKDAVLALRHSNECLAQALSVLSAPGALGDAGGERVARSSLAERRAEALAVLREHLLRSATVLRAVERTHLGRRLLEGRTRGRRDVQGRRDREGVGRMG